MKTVSATDLARHLDRFLDALECGGEEIVVLRDARAVARLVPAPSKMKASEALGNLHRAPSPADGGSWLRDAGESDRVLEREMRDPWA